MNMIKRLLHALAMSVVVLTLSGCATINMGEYLDDKTVKIERIDSKHAKIGFVNIKRSDQETWIRGDIKPCIQTRGPIFGHLHVNVKSPDGKSIFNDAILNFNLGIGKFSGGGIMTIPNAIFNDGVLNGVYVKDIAAYKILLNIPNLFNGKYTHLKEVEQFSGSRINLEFTEDQWIEADGELMGPSNKYQIEVLPRVFRIISAA